LSRELLKPYGEKSEIYKGDSENLHTLFPARSFDFVVDIESSFYYPDKLAFIRGVHHVLKDDGLFVLAFYI
jgi:SAM-dependent methyltransferase